MPRLLVRHRQRDRDIDHLEVDELGAWRRERRAMGRAEAEVGRLSTSDAAALVARIEAVLPTAPRAAGKDPDNVIVLSGFRANPAAFTVDGPGFAALDAALASFPWELPALAAPAERVSACWRTGAGCGAHAYVRIDSLGGVELEQERGNDIDRFDRVRIPPETAAALFADLRPRWPDASPPRRMRLPISVRWLTARFEGDPEPGIREVLLLGSDGARRVDDDSPAFAPLLERIRAALGASAGWVDFRASSGPPPRPRWAPVPRRITWRMTVADGSHVEGELGLDGRILQWRDYGRNSRLPEIALDPDRADVLFGLAARLVDETPGPSEWTPGHDRAPWGVHTLIVELLEADRGPRTIVDCRHSRPAYAALERALLDVLTK